VKFSFFDSIISTILMRLTEAKDGGTEERFRKLIVNSVQALPFRGVLPLLKV
jgi:hypothetical protein